MVGQDWSDFAVAYADGPARLQNRHGTLVHVKVELAGFIEVPQHFEGLCAAVQRNARINKWQEPDMVDVPMTQNPRNIARLERYAKLLLKEPSLCRSIEHLQWWKVSKCR